MQWVAVWKHVYIASFTAFIFLNDLLLCIAVFINCAELKLEKVKIPQKDLALD